MPNPNLPVPQFPNVPYVPGVPALVRASSELFNTITGNVGGRILAGGGFSGTIDGTVFQINGLVTGVSGVLTGTMDLAGNISAALTGAVGGNVLGSVTGSIDSLTGAVSGQLGGTIGQLAGDIGVLGGDSSSLSQSQASPQWGIFNAGGEAALTADSILAFDFDSEYRISDYPVEGGVFQSYNKVQVPFTARFVYTKGGTDAERTAFLNAAESLEASLDAFTAVTPEKTYPNVNVTHVNYRRMSDHGVTLITVEIWTQQIRVSAAATFASSTAAGTTPALDHTKTAAGASTRNNGAVLADLPSTANFDPNNYALRTEVF